MSSNINPVASNPWTKNTSVSGSPWGKPSNPVQPCSLEDVMSEQLASELQNKEAISVNEEQELQECLKLSEAVAASPQETVVKSVGQTWKSPAEMEQSDAEVAARLAAEDVGYDPNDELIAVMLQKEFDREYDAALSKQEQKYNGNSKVSISFDNYKRKHMQAEYQNGDDDDEDDDDFYDEEMPEHPNATQWENGAPTMGNRGYSGQGKNIVTKHDKVICERRNAQRLMQFPPDFVCGDGEGMDMQLPNKVYNKLKQHAQSDNKKGHRVHDKKDYSTAIKAVDEKTRILIFKMINSEFLSSVDGVISEGKEAVVFKAIGGKKDEVDLPRDVILKIFKTSMNEFKTRLKYMIGDYRLSKDVFKKFNARKLMRMWAEKEFLNLKKLKRHGIPCPEALALKKHVLVMTCVGGEKPALKLKEVVLSTEDLQDAYEQTIDIMKNMYLKCNMVHADFSAYNLLWHDGKVWVIDVGQAVDRDNKSSASFLLRDCKNVCDFFKQGGVYGVPSAEDLFNEITNYLLEGEGKVFESQVKRYEKEDYSFDYFFEMSETSRLQKLDIVDSDDSSSGSEDDQEEIQLEDDVCEDVDNPVVDEKTREIDESDGHIAAGV